MAEEVNAISKENKHADANAGVVIGMLMIIFSFIVVVFNTNAGLVGIVAGLVVLIISGIFAVAKKNKSELSEENCGVEYAETVRKQVIQNAQLTKTEIENLLAKYCKVKNLFGNAAAQEISTLLQARGGYLDSDDALDNNYSVNLGYGLMMNVKVDKLPEDDEQESQQDIADVAFQEVMKNQPQAAVSKDHYTLFYTDFNGNKTRREIDFKEFLEDGKLYIKAWCHLRKDLRQFDICRIERLFDCAGKEIPNPEIYFRQMYKNSDGCKIADYFKSHFVELEVLVFLARADGQMRKNEREVVAEYIRRTLPDVSSDILDSRIKACSCEFSDFKNGLKLLAEEPAELRNALVDSAEKIYALKKSPDAMETGVFQKIQELRK